MGRCLKTAEAIAEAYSLTAETCNELNDIDYRAWQFKTQTGVRSHGTLDISRLRDGIFLSWFSGTS
jgi:broad specificity phosphatase PhoE